MQRVRSRTGLAVLGGLALVIVLLGLAQLILPGIAADRIRSRIARYGGVAAVSVSAWPAVELLWGHADSVKVSATHLSLSPARAASLLWEGHGVSRLDLRAASVDVGGLELTDATLQKRGDSLSAQALTTPAAAQAALPPGLRVGLLRSGDGEVEVRAAGGLFGIEASVDAIAGAQDGNLVAHPLGPLIEALQLTIFSDPHVYVEGIGASATAGGYRLQMSARLR